MDRYDPYKSATDKNVGTKISREPLEFARAIDGLTEWQKHVQTDSNINRDITVAIEALKAQLGTNLAEVGTRAVRGYPIDADALMEKVAGEYGERARDRLYQIIRYMPPAQLEQTNCDYCNEDVDGYVKPIEKNGHAFIRFGMNGWELSLQAKGWHGSAKIRYCPMCGRDLFVK